MTIEQETEPGRADAGADLHASDRGEHDDEVIGLREWGSRTVVPLRVLRAWSADSQGEPGGPRPGVQVMYEDQLWRIRDRGGGLRQDGISVREVVLTAGSEIAIEGMTFIAESLGSMALRQFCGRLIGWSDERLCEIDQALRSIRLAGSRRAPLLLQGQGDLVLIAQAIHRYTLGQRAPFIVADPRRGNQPATVRGPANRRDGVAALHEAAGGSLCVRELRLPAGFDTILRTFREPGNDVQLLICARPRLHDTVHWGSAVIELPRLEARASELPRIISEYALEARAMLDAPESCFTERDLDWITRVSADSIPDIEKATLRVVAVRMSRTLQAASDRLGVAPVSLSRWLARRARDPRTGARVRPPTFRTDPRMLPT